MPKEPELGSDACSVCEADLHEECDGTNERGDDPCSCNCQEKP